MATFTWAPSRPFARANCLVPYAGNFLLPCYTGSVVYQSTATALSALSLGVFLPSVSGWSDATTDTSGSAWLLPANGSFLVQRAGGAGRGSATTTYSLSVKPAWTGIAAIGTTPYMLSSDGNLYTLSGSTVTAVTGGSFGHEALSLTTDGTNLWTLLPTVSELAKFTVSTAAITTSATPMTTPSCVAANPSGVAVGGWSPSALAQDTVAIAASPISPTTTSAAISTSGNQVLVVSGTDPAWSVTQTITGTGAPSALTWTPNGEQGLVCDKTNGKLQVYNLSGFTLSAGTLLSIAGVSSIAPTPDSTMAVATQPGANQLQVLANTLGVWSLGTTIADTNGPQAIIPLSQTEMVYGITGGITFLEYVTAAWSVGTRVTGFGFTVTGLTTDGAGNIYAIGSSGSTGFLTVASKAGGILASTSWTGSADSILWNQGQIFVVDSTSSLVRAFAYFAGGLHAESTTATPAGCKGIALAGASVWLSGSTSLGQFQMSTPYTLKAAVTGEVSVYNGSAWASCVLPTGKRPSAVTWDGSGNVWAATEQNDIYEISAAGALLSHTTVAVYPGQNAGTPMGLSSLLWSGGHLYASTSLAGALVEIQ